MGPAFKQNVLNNPSFGWHSSIGCLARAAALLLMVAISAAAQVNVTTFHMDNGRTGQNTNETILTTSNVNVSQFGKLFAQPVDAPVFAQPLYVANVMIGGTSHNVVFVATENDSVYAFDADSNTGANATYLWKASLVDAAHGAPVGAAAVIQSDLPCGGTGTFGVTSTPVIDTSTNTMYVVAFSQENGELVNRLHALDITTGNEKSQGPVVIDATVNGTGDGSSAGQLTFSKMLQFIRPGLLLSNSTVYVASGALCEGDGPFHGWVFGYNASTFAQTGVFNTTPNGGLGGIWMAGSGLAADSSGNLFVATGNGSFDTTNIPATMFGDTFLKLSSTLTLSDYFTPWNQAAMDGVDNDLGSGGVLLLPTQPGANPDELVEAGKLGTIYVVNRDQMTAGNLHYCTTCTSVDTQILQELPGAVGGMWAMPAYWNSNVYFWGQGDVLKQYSVTNGVFSTSPVSQNTTSIGGSGTTPSISSNGTANGILWALAVGDLHAYEATNVANQLYDSGTAPKGRDTIDGGILKFTTPIIANGKVYVGTGSDVDVFGLLSGGTSTAAVPTFSPNPGTITSSQQITISDATSGYTIYYTTNGSTPTAISSEQYTGPFTLSASATVQAMAVASGYQNSPIASAAYTVAPAAATPTLSPNGGTITNSQQISITDSTSGAVIYYTTNGSTPTGVLSEQYNGPFALPASATVKAIAVESGYANSNVASVSFTVSPPAATPTVSPNGGTITSSQQITISDTTPGYAIYYTTNGTAPTVTPSEKYTGGFTLSSSATVEAIAVASGFSNSSTAMVAFTVQGTGLAHASTPTVTPNGGSVSSAQNITLSDTTPGAMIYYTTDGVTTPTATPSEQYGGAFTLSSSTTVQAIAVASGYSNSAVASVSFTVLPPAATPMLNPPGGTITPSQQIILTDATSGVPIYYTIDGSDPIPTPSEQYTGPFTLNSSTTVLVTAIGAGYSPSVEIGGIYTVQSSAPVVNYVTGFTSSSGLTLNGGAVVTSANRLRLTDGGSQEARSAFFTTPENVQAFTNDFSFQLTNPNADGFTFTIQNNTANALGPAGGGLGYGWGSTGIPLSVAVKFDLYNNDGEGVDSTGMYTDGTPPMVPAADMTSSGVSLHSGDIMNVHMTYNGTTLVWTITDATTGASFSDSAAVNIPSTVGSSTAYVGFTAGTGGQSSTQEILSWTYASSNQSQSPAATPTFSEGTGTYSGTQSITLSDATSGAVIYYAINAVPTTSSTKYTPGTPITVSTSETIEAIAVETGYTQSAVASATYTITAPAASPTFSPTGGTISTTQQITISDTTPGYAIYYTTNGTVPSVTPSELYSGPFTLPTSATVEAMAVATGYTNSAVASASYMLQQAATPTFSEGTGTYSGTQSITLSDATSGAVIYYAINAVPTTSSTKYTPGTPITVSTSETIEAIAVETGYTQSPVASAAYTITSSATINYASFTSSSGLSLNGAVITSANRLRLTDGGATETRSAFFTTPVNVQAFTNTFSFQVTNPNADGFTFTIQNNSPTIVGPSGGGLGYGAAAPGYPLGIPLSVAVKFDLYNNDGEGSDSTGIYTDGASPTIPAVDMTSSGVNLHSGDVMNVQMTYNGTTLAWTITDATTGASFSDSVAVNIPSTVGSSTAYVGFTAGTGGESSTQEILSWTFTSTQPTAATPTFSEGTGTYSGTQSITLSDATSGAVIYYAINAVPTTSSTKYTPGTPITVSTSETIEAIAVETGYTQSAVASATYTITSSSTINYASFTSSSGLTLNGAVITSANRLRLTDGGATEGRSAFFTTPVNVQAFTNTFSFQLTNPNADGFTFTIQNSGPTAVGPAGGGLGYGAPAPGGPLGIPLSMAVKFDLYNNDGEGSDSTGMYTDGASPTVPAVDMTSSGVNLHSGDVMNVQMTYNGTTLSWTITDATTGASFTDSVAVNIPSTVGSSTACVGFTAGTGGESSTQEILSWTFTSSDGPEL